MKVWHASAVGLFIELHIQFTKKKISRLGEA